LIPAHYRTQRAADKRLDDIDLAVLEELVAQSVEHMRKAA
jgi:hypothetical protein